MGKERTAVRVQPRRAAKRVAEPTEVTTKEPQSAAMRFRQTVTSLHAHFAELKHMMSVNYNLRLSSVESDISSVKRQQATMASEFVEELQEEKRERTEAIKELWDVCVKLRSEVNRMSKSTEASVEKLAKGGELLFAGMCDLDQKMNELMVKCPFIINRCTDEEAACLVQAVVTAPAPGQPTVKEEEPSKKTRKTR